VVVLALLGNLYVRLEYNAKKMPYSQIIWEAWTLFLGLLKNPILNAAITTSFHMDSAIASQLLLGSHFRSFSHLKSRPENTQGIIS